MCWPRDEVLQLLEIAQRGSQNPSLLNGEHFFGETPPLKKPVFLISAGLPASIILFGGKG